MVQKDSIKNKERIIVIGGPTCVKKSDYAVDIALKYNGEVISADSVQLYRKLDIGSGKLTKEEMRGVPHHLMDFLDPEDNSYSVALYIKDAKRTITDIISCGKIPIIVGGSGFYINALIHGFNCGGSGPNHTLRLRLEGLEAKYGKNYLFDMLTRINKDTTLHPNDKVRIIRQLELYLSPTCDNDESASVYHNAYDAVLIIMDADRNKLDEYAEKRINGMFEAGIINEVKGLERYFNCRCMETVGYKEIVNGLLCNKSDEEIKADMLMAYHKLIKKQQTFFRWLQWDNKTILYNWDRTEADKKIAEFMSKTN